MEKHTDFYEMVLSQKAERFDVDALSEYNLYLSVGNENFKLVVVDTNTGECLFLEHFRFYNSLPLHELIIALNRLYENHLFLKANFWNQIYVSIQNTPFTLVPNEHFEEPYMSKYLKPTAKIAEDDYIFSYEQVSIEAQNIFVVQRDLVNWFKEVVYPSSHVIFTHQSTAFIEGIFKGNLHSSPVQVHILVENRNLTIAVKRGNVLEFLNAFTFYTAQDFVYFVIFIIDELRLDPKTCPIYLYGNITTRSSIFDLIYRYVHHIIFIKDEFPQLKFSQDFESISQHQYFDTFSMHYLSGA